MDDLIARSLKYAISAGRTGKGQYDAAERADALSRWLSWSSVALGAIVGTSLFAEWAARYPVPLGLAALTAAAATALQRTSKLDERAEEHRVAGAEYGRLRRRADMLRLRIAGGDVSREEGLVELDRLGEELSELAKRTRSLPESIYRSARAAFDRTHKEYGRLSPTHAGGVVRKTAGGEVRYLLVRATGDDREWVLPKGHIRPGETPEQAGRREVLEETGVVVAVRDLLDTVQFAAPKGRVRADFFLMDAVSEREPAESREHTWLPFDEAASALGFKEAQWLLWLAEAVGKRQSVPRPL